MTHRKKSNNYKFKFGDFILVQGNAGTSPGRYGIIVEDRNERSPRNEFGCPWQVLMTSGERYWFAGCHLKLIARA